MKILHNEVVWNGRFISVSNIYFQDMKGDVQVWESVKRKTFGKIVSICAITEAMEAILIKVFRIPFGGYVIEFPAGLMDKPKEEPPDVVKRELLEETGYTFEGKPEVLIEGPFNAGLVADNLAVFYASGARKVREPSLEPTEDIETLIVPLNSLEDLLLNPPKGCTVDMKLFSILYMLQRKGVVSR